MSNPRQRREFLVSIDMPPNATVAAMTEYVKDSVRSFCGGLPPEDPLFEINRESITVRAIPIDRPRKS